jgi:hypothetical protein
VSGKFYLHEDDWGMIELLPVENMAGRQRVAEAARQFSQEHADGVGWTAMFEVPEAAHSLEERQIQLAELRALVGAWLPEAAMVESGYSSSVETVAHSFAFGGAAAGLGAFYGTYKGDIITGLYCLRPDGADAVAVARFAALLAMLGQRHRLMLADWWSDTLVDLRDAATITSYLHEGADPLEDSATDL